jgi:hypothetical protein
VPPSACLLRIRFGAFYVRERDLQTAPECEEAVHAFYMDDQSVLGKLHFGHGGVLPSFVHTLASSYPSSHLANHGAPAFSLHVPLATNTSEHATQRSLAHLQRRRIHRSAWKKGSRKFAPEYPSDRGEDMFSELRQEFIRNSLAFATLWTEAQRP